MNAEQAPVFSIPLAATLVAAVGASGFAIAVRVVLAASSPAEWPWVAAAAVFYTFTAAFWAGLLHAIGTRRMFRGCALHRASAALRPEESSAFEISDPQRKLRSAKALEISLAWRETSTRVGGRKVYTEGPFELRGPLRWEHRDALPGSCGPGLAGEFRVERSEIVVKRLAEWTQRIEILIRVRSCFFVLPLEEPQ